MATLLSASEALEWGGEVTARPLLKEHRFLP